MTDTPGKKRILFILPHFYHEVRGGAEVQSLYIAEELVKRGWRVSYCRERNVLMNYSKEHIGIKLIALPRVPLFSKSQGVRSMIINRYLGRILKQDDYDVIYIRADEIYLPCVMKHIIAASTKVVWACAHDYKTRDRYFQNRYGERLGNSILTCLKRDIVRVFQTEYQRSAFHGLHAVDGIVIRNGHPVPISTGSGASKLVTWIGGLQECKRPELFIQMAEHINLPDVCFTMVLKKCTWRKQKAIRTLISNCKHLSIHYDLTQAQIHNLLLKSRVLVNTSSAEGFPNTFIEAWLRGIPVVSLNIDPDGYIHDNALGRVSGSMKCMCEDVLYYLNTNKWLAESIHIREYAEIKFDSTNVVDALLARIEL